MEWLGGGVGLALVLVVLWDAFETIVLPRRIARRVRLTRFFYRSTWRPWSAVADLLRPASRRQAFLGFFGPLSLLFLLGVWAAGLVIGFALLDWAAGSPVRTPAGAPSFLWDLYLSGTTFFTLGIGDVTPESTLARSITVIEAGTGFGFLAIVIGYLPVIYQAFSRREVSISLLDARAGSPPTAGELLRRHAGDHGLAALQQILHDWEHWSAELLESHLSYPVLAYFRSQHKNQSWLGALTAILDTSALVTAGVQGACRRQAELTFAMARHAVVDLAQVFRTAPKSPRSDRLPPEDFRELQRQVVAAGFAWPDDPHFSERFAELRRLYEPYVSALGRYLRMDLPPWFAHAHRADNWQTSAWGKDRGSEPPPSDEPARDDHF
jgi:Ion channel